MGGRAVLVLFGALALSASAALGAGEAELCDALAGEAPGAAVPLEAIDADQAIAACAAALALDPANPRLVHQYARALERAGRLEDARRLYGLAAAGGYPLAAAALARLDAVAANPGPAWTDAQREQVAASYSALSAAVRRYANGLPDDFTDPLSVLATTGPDAAAIADWLTTNTRLVPYVGSLRGAQGVLLDRAGNSLDRALALAALLSGSGEEVRLARTTLGEAEAEALFAVVNPAAGMALPDLTRQDYEALLADPRLRPDLVQTALTQYFDQQANNERLLRERTEALVPAILPAVMFNAAGADEAARDAAIEALRDYFWVQIRSGTDWRDIVLDAEAIGTPVAAETMAVDAVPESLRHSVTIRVVLELQDPAQRREETLLAHVLYPADTGYQTLSLSHVSPALGAVDQVIAAGGADVPQRALDILANATSWTPVLTVGDNAVVDRLFTRDGQLRDADANALAQTGATIGNLFGNAGNLLGGAEAPAVEPATPTAEWIEIAVYVPGVGERVERRTIFDLVGPAARSEGAMVAETPGMVRQRALQLIGTTDIAVIGAVPSDVHLARLGAETLARGFEAAALVAASPVLPSPMDIVSGPRVPLQLLEFAVERLAERPAALTVPNVFLSHFRLAIPEDVPATVFDIVFNDVPDLSFEEQLRQGIVDTILEDVLVTGGVGPNVATLHAADLAAGRLWAVIDGAVPAAAPPDARVRIAADMAAGYVVVAPIAPTGGEFGWWRIDPLSGRTLGIMASGGGQTMGEYALAVLNGVSAAGCMVMLGLAAAQVIGGGVGLGATMAVCAIAGGAGVAAGGAAGSAGAGLGVGGGFSALAMLVAGGGY